MDRNILHRSLMVGSLKESTDINDYLTIEALEDGLTASLSTNACEYCIDGSMEWTSLAAGTATPVINTGQTLSFRAKLKPTSSAGIGTFTISNKCNLLGNCMSMLFGGFANGKKSLVNYDYAFYELFDNCTNIINVSSNFLPATTLADCCYIGMFYGCTSLTSAPELPATTLAYMCYRLMFENCKSLTTAPELPATTLVKYCYQFMFEGCSSLITAPELPATTLSSNCYERMFYGCTSLITAPELPATTLTIQCYEEMFYGCTSLTTAPELPATTLASSCYEEMFYGCTSLTTAPELPATTLYHRCYRYMFYNCSNLTTAPNLPATTLASNCYSGMFYNCTSLITAPELPATTLTSQCYEEMFYNCRSLTTAPELPATTLINDCYNSMFSECRSLTTAPELPATTLANDCYSGMFSGCTSLTTAPKLPATTLVSNCYYYMFYGCTSLTSAPELPATTLASRCYSSMFMGCTSLTTAPELPATTLASNCYEYLFMGCTSLINAPELPATTLTASCYHRMFHSCKKVNYIKMLATDISATDCLSQWVSGVAYTGTFVKSTYAQWDVVGENGVPNRWTITYTYTPQECTSLTITADDVSGKSTTTTIHWEAVTNGVNEDGSTAQGIVMSGTATSEEFPQNTSETDTVTREISFTYMGVTATTTITQGVWIPSGYTVDLNSQWQESTAIANPDSATYDGVYESFSNYNVNNEYATMYIDITGYETFQLYIRSYAEGNYDYVMVSQLDQTITGSTSYSDTTLVKAHTRGSQSSGTAISNYKLVEFTGIDSGDHRITIVYRKDSSAHSGLDRGYVLIPKNQN